jgi:hypothetical protein
MSRGLALRLCVQESYHAVSFLSVHLLQFEALSVTTVRVRRPGGTCYNKFLHQSATSEQFMLKRKSLEISSHSSVWRDSLVSSS